MHKRSLFFEAQQDGASPQEGLGNTSRRSGETSCRALVKFEPAPEWLILYRKIDFKK
ncbi:MAG: hypothetical protein IKC65_02750 [Lentisphaeria bacterium]|nr:hypothetical protein [Lentisphaeria bacterium]